MLVKVVLFWFKGGLGRFVSLSTAVLTILIDADMPPAAPHGRGPIINPTLCAAITSFVIGTAIGIGIGVLIENQRY